MPDHWPHHTFPALTIWQPWATLIIVGAKPVEWRGWPAPRWVIGHRIAIHAGARPVRLNEVYDIRTRLEDDESSLIAEIAEPLLRTVHIRSWPLSSVIGTAIIGAPIPALDWVKRHSPDFADSDRLDHSKFAWPLTEIKRFEPPIPARGAQGFWRWRQEKI